MKETLYKFVTKCFKVISARKFCFWLNNQLFNMAKSEVILFKTVRNWPGFALQTRWLIMVFSILVVYEVFWTHVAQMQFLGPRLQGQGIF